MVFEQNKLKGLHFPNNVNQNSVDYGNKTKKKSADAFQQALHTH